MLSKFEIECWLKRLYRRGPRFRQMRRELEVSQHFTPEEIREYQNRQLRAMVTHCYQNVPYYRDLFRQLKLDPESIRTRDDLQKLPLLDKKVVQENFDKFISKSHYNFLCKTGTTSGTTGRPGKFVRDFDAINFEHAVTWRHWENAGDTGKKRISLRGDVLVPVARNHPPFWKYNPANRELLMSSYHQSQANGIHYVRKILEFQAKVLYCGPSAGYLLAKFFRSEGVDYKFDAIFTSSESLEPEVRALVEETFQCRISDWYGQAERVSAIGQCKYGTYHIQEDYSITELLPGEDEDTYELVGTQFCNRVMPLLRYRTQDFVRISQPSGCLCGSHFRIVDQIIGRAYGYLLTPEGYNIAITTHIPVGVDNVLEAQFYQERPGEVVLKVLTNGRFTDADREQLVRNTLKYTSPHMKVIVKEVDDIPRGPNGKFINIINRLETVS